MSKSTTILGLSLVAILAIGMACEKKNLAPVPAELQQQIALGERLFYQKDCGKCHSMHTTPENAKGSELTAVHLAEDSLLAKYRLYHFESSEMPPIPLTHQEISALTQFLACQSVHAGQPHQPRRALPGVRRRVGQSRRHQKFFGSLSQRQIFLF